MRLLQAQIEPHFLFNTLSNVISLLDIDVGKAKQMLIDVNAYLRISLQRTRQEMITLSQELDLVRHYLDIYKIRMGKRLSYTINDETGQPDLSFPPLIVQPLVENAIKYGLEPKVDGGEIVIRSRIEGQMLTIVIADDGCGLDDSTSQAGIGIDNVSQRLESIYGSKADLLLVPNQPEGLKCIIKVLETILDPKQFWRVHRSSIVNIDKIKATKRSFTNQMIVVFHQTEHTIAVSRAYEHLFKQM